LLDACGEGEDQVKANMLDLKVQGYPEDANIRI